MPGVLGPRQMGPVHLPGRGDTVMDRKVDPHIVVSESLGAQPPRFPVSLSPSSQMGCLARQAEEGTEWHRAGNGWAGKGAMASSPGKGVRRKVLVGGI